MGKPKRPIELSIGRVWKGTTRKGKPETRKVTGLPNVIPRDWPGGEYPRGYVRYDQNGEPNAWADAGSFREWAESAELVPA